MNELTKWWVYGTSFFGSVYILDKVVSQYLQIA